MRGVQASKGKQRSSRRRQGVDFRLREESEKELVQDLESDVLRQLVSSAGADSNHSKERSGSGAEARCADSI